MKIMIGMNGVIVDWMRTHHFDPFADQPNPMLAWNESLNTSEFWRLSPKHAEADALIEMCLDKVGQQGLSLWTSRTKVFNIAVLQADGVVVELTNTGVNQGKRQWYQDNYPDLRFKIVGGPSRPKWLNWLFGLGGGDLYATKVELLEANPPGHVIVLEDQENRAARYAQVPDVSVVLVPRPWNSNAAHEPNLVSFCADRIDEIIAANPDG